MMKSQMMKSQMMKFRTDVINYFIKQRNYKTYLEIGVREGDNFVNVVCTEKIGVDPSFKKMRESVKPYCVCTTSDIFFKNIDKDQKFDIIFIDADHTYEQVVKDINNSMNHLSANGVIIMHDVWPANEFTTVPFQFDTYYNGTVYQAFIQQIMMNEIHHKYNVYSTKVDHTGVIDTDTSYKVNKDDNLLAKYIDIIKSYLHIQRTEDMLDLNNKDTLYAIVSTYRIGYPDYDKNKSWLYPVHMI